MKALATVLLLSSLLVDSHPIKHVVVLMLENRSFDHLLGFMKKLNPETTADVLDGSEFNLATPHDSSSKVHVTPNGYDEGPDDPMHDFWSTAEQIYGFRKPNDQDAQPLMNGFVQNAAAMNHNISNPMAMFDPIVGAPILNTLATEYAVFDRWFSSIPGPTDPNRGFAMSGTSDGNIWNFNGTLWKQQSYFDFLRKRGHTFSGYYQDNLWALFYFDDVVNEPKNRKHMKPLETFYKDLDEGYLADFTWLQPRLIPGKAPPTWQHPDASVREGERLIKEIYEALVDSEFWDELVFIITYDEHGGFYDHVPPPQDGIPPPDNVVDPSFGFKFDRLGVRVPTIAISPWLNRGTVISKPSGPFSNSEFEHTSIIATMNVLLGITDHPSLRAQWSGTFEGIFHDRSEPRQDCPKKLPDIESWSTNDLDAHRELPLNEHLEIQVQYYCKFNSLGDQCGEHITNQGHAADFITGQVHDFLLKLELSETE